MGITYDSCRAVILAGGRSRRMGTCKALLPKDGQPLIQYIHGQLSDFSDCCLSANDPVLDGYLPVPVIRDCYPDCGPMAGIHAALKDSEQEAIFVVSCDLPFFSRELPEQMLRSFPADADAMVCRDSSGRVHPLCGIYRKRLLPRIGALLDHGDRKLMILLDQINCAYFDIGQYLPENLLFNMNTPEDYRNYRNGVRE